MKSNRWLVLPFVLGVIILGWYAQSKLTYDFNVSTFTAEHSKEYRNYREYSDQFPQPVNTSLLGSIWTRR